MSGRALRRLPVLALARYIGVGSLGNAYGASQAPNGRSGAPVEVWLAGMEKAVSDQGMQQEKLI